MLEKTMMKALSFVGATCFGICLYLISYVYFLANDLPLHLNGQSTIELRPTAQLYKNFIERHHELGSSFSVLSGHSTSLLSMVGGYTDLRFQLRWTAETVTQLFTLSSIAVPFTFALLIDRGLVNTSDRLTRYLPSLPTQDSTIEDLLTHRTGFPYFLDQLSLAQWHENPSLVVLNITRQVPQGSPGQQQFHFHSQALVADAIVRKVDPKRRTLAHFFTEEVAWTLGIDILIGIPRSQLYRAARTYHSGLLDTILAAFYMDLGYAWRNLITSRWMPFNSRRLKALGMFTDYKLINNWNPDLLELPLTSTHMFANSRSMARLLSVLYPSDSNSTTSSNLFRHWQSTVVDWMLQPNSDRPVYDPVLSRKVTLTRSGLMIGSSPEGQPVYGFWDDIMGQFAYADPHRRLAMAYVTNHAHGRSLNRDFILNLLEASVYKCLPAG